MNIWNLKAYIYQKARQLPGFSHILNAETDNLKKLLNDLKPDSLLDIGVGTGATLSIYDEDMIIYGIDFSFKMLKQVRMHHPDLTGIQANACQLPLQKKSFSFISAIGLTEYLPDLTVFFEEVDMILKPEGYLLITFAPNTFFNYLRLAWGSRLFLQSEKEWVNSIPTHWKQIGHNASWLQRQFLYQKQ